MDWELITHHMLSGYVPAMAALVLYFVVLYVAGKKQTVGHVIASFVFCLYLIGILTVTGICLKGSFSPRIVYIPFVDMIRGPKDTALNVILFVPMGTFLPALYEKYDRIGKVAIIGFLISLSVEIVQMFGYGATDINDLITNTIGTCLGFCIYTVLYRVFPKSWIKQIQVKGVQGYLELLLFWIGSLLIMITIQLHIFHAFFSTGIAGGGAIQEWK